MTLLSLASTLVRNREPSEPIICFQSFLPLNELNPDSTKLKKGEKISHQCLCQLFFHKWENISEFSVGKVLDYYSWCLTYFSSFLLSPQLGHPELFLQITVLIYILIVDNTKYHT